jgi:hypothetical protein
VTSKELRRLEIDELLAYADTGEQERVEAALELLRRRQAKQLRKKTRLKPRPSTEALKSVGLGTGPDT